jgi:nitronate monooxygenase
MLLTELLGITLPIIQAPMAGVQSSALAIAAGRSGALGSLPCATLTPAQLRGELQSLRRAKLPSYNVNFFCHRPPEPSARDEEAWRASLAPAYAEFDIDPAGIPTGAGRVPFDTTAAELLGEFQPPVVSFHFGLPARELLAKVKSWGAVVMSSATTVEEARWLEAHGADVIVAQGLEAGGHRGIFLTDDPVRDLTTQLGTFALLPQVVCAVRCPVVAAGGIADAAGVAAAMALGAAGVQVGTAYLLCPEASTSAVHRAALLSPAAAHTALTNLFTGRPARGIVNRFIREHGPLSPLAPAFPLAGAAIAPLRAKAEGQGLGDYSPLWAGQNVSGCRTVPAADVTRALAAGLAGPVAERQSRS